MTCAALPTLGVSAYSPEKQSTDASLQTKPDTLTPEPLTQTLWTLSPAEHGRVLSPLSVLDADLRHAVATRSGSLLAAIEGCGLEMLRLQLPNLTRLATITPTVFWALNKLARWQRFFRRSADQTPVGHPAGRPPAQTRLPNPCHPGDLQAPDPAYHYRTLQPLGGRWLAGYPMDQGVALNKHLSNERVAELLTRLSLNDRQRAESSADSLTYQLNGQKIHRLSELTQYLKAAGYHIRMTTGTRVADFFGLHHANEDGKITPVAIPVFFQTQWEAAQGNDSKSAVTAALPMMHSETIIRITPPVHASADEGQETVTDPFNAQLLWLMGVSGIGFRAGDQEQLQAWSAPREYDLADGEQAWELINVMGLLTRALHDIGQAHGFSNDAYFVEGACNDYAALLQAYAGHPPSAFPITLSKDYLVPYLERILADGVDTASALDPADQVRAKRLLEILKTFPNDLQQPSDQVNRALGALPWAPDSASPWPQVDAARAKINALRQATVNNDSAAEID